MSERFKIDRMHQVALTTTNLEQSTAFCRNVLGLRLIATFDPPGLAFYQVGDIRLSVQRVDKPQATSAVIYFHVDDIDAAARALHERGIELEQDPAVVFQDEQGQFGNAGENEWMAFFRDPDGNLLAFASRRQP